MSPVGTSPYAGLEPIMWRSLLARAAVFHAVRASLARLTDATDQMQAVQLVLLELDLLARNLSALDCDDATAVATVVRDWKEILVQAIAKKPAGEEERTLLLELQERIQTANMDDPFKEL